MWLGQDIPDRNYILYIREVPLEKKEIKELIDETYLKYPTYAYNVRPSLRMYVEGLKNGTLR
jgi:hypothetical protein